MSDEGEPLHVWHTVSGDMAEPGKTERMRVPGGWLYAVRQGRIILTMCFVPEPVVKP